MTMNLQVISNTTALINAIVNQGPRVERETYNRLTKGKDAVIDLTNPMVPQLTSDAYRGVQSLTKKNDATGKAAKKLIALCRSLRATKPRGKTTSSTQPPAANTTAPSSQGACCVLLNTYWDVDAQKNTNFDAFCSRVQRMFGATFVTYTCGDSAGRVELVFANQSDAQKCVDFYEGIFEKQPLCDPSWYRSKLPVYADLKNYEFVCTALPAIRGFRDWDNELSSIFREFPEEILYHSPQALINLFKQEMEEISDFCFDPRSDYVMGLAQVAKILAKGADEPELAAQFKEHFEPVKAELLQLAQKHLASDRSRAIKAAYDVPVSLDKNEVGRVVRELENGCFGTSLRRGTEDIQQLIAFATKVGYATEGLKSLQQKIIDLCEATQTEIKNAEALAAKLTA